MYPKSIQSHQGHLRHECHPATQLKQQGTYIGQQQYRKKLEMGDHFILCGRNKSKLLYLTKEYHRDKKCKIGDQLLDDGLSLVWTILLRKSWGSLIVMVLYDMGRLKPSRHLVAGVAMQEKKTQSCKDRIIMETWNIRNTNMTKFKK